MEGGNLVILKSLKSGNTGVGNEGIKNTGDYNVGMYNSGYFNVGRFNTGYKNLGNYNTGDHNVGDHNVGSCNASHYNTGTCNTGCYNTGSGNVGSYNSGGCNSGSHNTGHFNSADYSSGLFCTTSAEIRLFNKPSGLTPEEFYRSDYWKALTSVEFPLVEKVTPRNNPIFTDWDLHYHTYAEACRIWWDAMTEENKSIIMSMPNFDKDIFYTITGIVLNEDI